MAQFLTGHLFDGEKRKIIVKQTHPLLYERANLGGCLLLTINYDAFFFASGLRTSICDAVYSSDIILTYVSSYDIFCQTENEAGIIDP